jgi:hypothetical protein
MALDFYTSRQLYRIMYDDRLDAPTSYWLDQFFPDSFLSTSEEIYFEKIPSSRKIAPFMLPNEQGKPIYRRQGETLQSFRPAYTKPKDAVRPTEMLKRQPGEIMGEGQLTLKARYDAEVIRIAQFQRNAITRLWDFMAAKAILDGAVTVNYIRDGGSNYPSVLVSFGRDAGQTVVLGAGVRWGDAGVSIVDSIQSFADTMAGAAFGGFPNRITFGSAAWAIARKDAGLKDAMDLRYRSPSDIDLNRGIVRRDTEQPATYVGTFGAGIECYVYNGTFQNDDGSLANIMDPRDVVLTAPGVEGVKAFGAILDEDADLQATDIFPKMWSQKDPSARFIMSQSAPLMIPVNPNRTFRARVIA